jgi:putative ABC transport system permease protein
MKLNIFKKNKADSESVARHSGPKPKETWQEKHLGIRFGMILYISWKNLKTGKTRSLLTIGGVALGIGIITFLLCMGFGIQRMIVNEVTKNNPRDVIEVTNGNLDNFVYLNDEYVKKIMDIDGVESVERSVNTGGKVIAGDSQTDAVVFGANSGFLNSARINYRHKEQAFSDGENRAIISDKLARLIGYDNPIDAIGKKLTFNIVVSKDVSSQISEEKSMENNETEIVGVIEGADGVSLYLPFDIVNKNFGIDLAQNGKVKVKDLEKFDNIKQRLEQMGFVTESINDLIKDIDSFFTTMRVALVIFGIIIMSISVMGMLNTLSVSLLQRTKEIGILKALGTKRSDVFKMFVLESIIISFVGGIVGFFGGYAFAFAVNEALIYLGKKHGVELSYFVYLPSSFIIATGGFIIFLGIATGLMPAFRAAKIHALEALRYE